LLKVRGLRSCDSDHSTEFVSEAGVHTNTIECRWNSLKKSLPRFGTRKVLYDSYFAEYCVHRKYLEEVPDKFIEFMRLIGNVYHPPTQEETPTTVTDSALLMPAHENSGAAADVGNFELQFELSTDTSESEADYVSITNYQVSH